MLLLGQNGSAVGTFATNKVYTASGRKLKENIEPLNGVINDLMSLTPKTYDYVASSRTKPKSIGFIAHEVNYYFLELVLDDSMDFGEVMMQLNYAGFGVLAIKAIQEQQEMIQVHDAAIQSQQQALMKLQIQVQNLFRRITELERS